ncbi:cytochrome c biogenesis protein CcdA [bacterium]|nr:cytochrome c biogenesis protein CcdA [bacterium]
MENIQNYRLLGSFVFGLLSFASPCILPLIPAYLSYITGVSLENLKSSKNKNKTLFLSLFFVLGFTIIFTLLGASANWLGRILYNKRDLIRMIGALLIILFGFHLTGIIKFKILYSQKKINLKKITSGYIGALLLGIVFAFGWSPCVGPVLGSILTMASMEETVLKGMLLLFFYSLGIGVPFILTAILLEQALTFFSKIKKYYTVIQMITGIVLIIVGVLLFFDKFNIQFPF